MNDIDTSELISGAYSVVHVWKTLLNAIRAKSLGKTRQQARGGHGGRKANGGRAARWLGGRLLRPVGACQPRQHP